jgi:hypothetical protein
MIGRDGIRRQLDKIIIIICAVSRRVDLCISFYFSSEREGYFITGI